MAEPGRSDTDMPLRPIRTHVRSVSSAILILWAVTTACSPGAGRRADADSPADSIVGRWEGTATAFGAEAPLIVDFTRVGDTLRAAATMDIEALWLERPLANVRYEHPHVHFEFPDRSGNNGIFDGTRNGEVIEGQTTKSGRSLTMRFRRISRDVPVRAVKLDTIVFRSTNGARLEGTLHRPLTPGPHPAVVFIHGSGPGTRDDFAYLADRFVRQGIAAFAYDKRGSGRSGTTSYRSYAQLADDVEAAIGALRSRPAIVAADRIAICGLSEGGWIAPLVASRPTARVGAVVAVVAPGATYEINAVYQNVLRMRARNASETHIAEYRRLTQRVNEHVRRHGGAPNPALQRALDSAHAAGWTVATDLPRQLPAGRILESVRWGDLDYDPAPHWERVRVPTLLVLAERDRNVNSVEAESLIAAAVRRGGNSDLTVLVYPGANHNLMLEPDSAGPFHFPTPPRGYPDTLATWTRTKLSTLADPARRSPSAPTPAP